MSRQKKKKDTGVERARNTRYVLKRLWSYVAQAKGKLTIAIILTVAANGFALVGPFLTGLAINSMGSGLGQVQFERVFIYAGWMLLFYFLSAVLTYILAALMVHISQQVAYQMRRDLFNRLVKLPVSFFDRQQTGDILSRMSYDIDTINTSLSSDVVQIAGSIITVVGSLIMMLYLSPILMLIFVVTVPLSILFTRKMSMITRKLFRKRSRKLGEMNGFVEEMISGQKTIRSYVREAAVLEKFAIKNEEATEATYQAEYMGSIVGPSVNFINNFSMALIGVFGALLYLAGGINIGGISSFILYSRRFSGPINQAANIVSDIQSSLAAAERVFQTMDSPLEPADIEGAAEYEHVIGDVAFDHVSFGYLKDQVIIRDLSLHARPGQLIAIVGPTGAGKTTIINLLMRFYDPASGRILADGKENNAYTRKTLRGAFAMVLQDSWLFNGTIAANIAYGNGKISQEDVVNAAIAADADPFIRRLPEGYDTMLSDDGVNISKGQKQLITIARAMLSKKNMLILDEATSNVDTRTELRIQRAMRKLMENKTAFVIAHRLSTIQSADLILVVRDGDVIEQGTHGTLLDLKGYYYEMYMSQYA